MTKDYLDAFLTDIEQKKIEKFVEDKDMFEAVKKVLLFSIYNSGIINKGKPHDPMHNFAMVAASNHGIKNEQLGEIVRSAYQGINALELGLSDLMRYSPIPVEIKKENPAR
jgi:hypothetical protein